MNVTNLNYVIIYWKDAHHISDTELMLTANLFTNLIAYIPYNDTTAMASVRYSFKMRKLLPYTLFHWLMCQEWGLRVRWRKQSNDQTSIPLDPCPNSSMKGWQGSQFCLSTLMLTMQSMTDYYELFVHGRELRLGDASAMQHAMLVTGMAPCNRATDCTIVLLVTRHPDTTLVGIPHIGCYACCTW
jgi:hypothetical protein